MVASSTYYFKSHLRPIALFCDLSFLNYNNINNLHLVAIFIVCDFCQVAKNTLMK
jgi:hypothetical protein